MKHIMTKIILLSSVMAIFPSQANADIFKDMGLWVLGLYNHSKQDSTASNEGFKANTRGVVMGFNNQVSNAMMVGIGYGYTDISADADSHDTDIKGHNVFIYGQYQPSAWYANWMMGYGFSKYDEKMAQKAKYHVNSYSASIVSGYQFDVGLAPEWGLSYVLADQEAYDVGGDRVHSDKSDLLTGMLGLRYLKTFRTDAIKWTPRANVGVTYDFASDKGKANIEVVRGNNYQIRTRRLHRFGVEAGVGLTMTAGSWDVSFDYKGGYRKDFQNHTGMLGIKYNF